MYIISQREDCWIDSQYVTNVSGGDKMVFVGLANTDYDKSIQAAKYDNKEQAAFAAMLCLNALMDEEKLFQFPHKDDIDAMMEVAKCHRSKATSRKRSHGGS